MCVASARLAERLGLSKDELVVPEMAVNVANNSSLRIVGAGFVTLRDRAGGSTAQMVYFAEGIGDFYLSNSRNNKSGLSF